MLGTPASGEEAAVVSSKIVDGVSGGRDGASWYELLLRLDEARPERVEGALWMFAGKLVWLGRGVPLSGLICVQPSRNRSHKSQHACTADPNNSSSGALDARPACRKVNSISARAQQALRSASVSSARDVRCLINRWHSVT